MESKQREEAISSASEHGKFPLGTSRKPKFGEPMRGIWAGDDNPLRDGLYVETRTRKGRVNAGVFYRLTDGRGRFWEYWAKDTVFLTESD